MAWEYRFTFKTPQPSGAKIISSPLFEVITDNQLTPTDKSAYASLFSLVSERQIT